MYWVWLFSKRPDTESPTCFCWTIFLDRNFARISVSCSSLQLLCLAFYSSFKCCFCLTPTMYSSSLCCFNISLLLFQHFFSSRETSFERLRCFWSRVLLYRRLDSRWWPLPRKSLLTITWFLVGRCSSSLESSVMANIRPDSRINTITNIHKSTRTF